MNKKTSRVQDFDIEKCSSMTGLGKFEIILMAAARAREIRKQNPDHGQPNQLNTSMTALLEIQAGEIGAEYLKKVR